MGGVLLLRAQARRDTAGQVTDHFEFDALEGIMSDDASHQNGAQRIGREAECRLLQLPPELLGHIFSFISVADKAQARKKRSWTRRNGLRIKPMCT